MLLDQQISCAYLRVRSLFPTTRGKLSLLWWTLDIVAGFDTSATCEFTGLELVNLDTLVCLSDSRDITLLLKHVITQYFLEKSFEKYTNKK